MYHLILRHQSRNLRSAGRLSFPLIFFFLLTRANLRLQRSESESEDGTLSKNSIRLTSVLPPGLPGVLNKSQVLSFLTC